MERRLSSPRPACRAPTAEKGCSSFLISIAVCTLDLPQERIVFDSVLVKSGEEETFFLEVTLQCSFYFARADLTGKGSWPGQSGTAGETAKNPACRGPCPSAVDGPRSRLSRGRHLPLYCARLWGCALSSRSFFPAGDTDSEPATKYAVIPEVGHSHKGWEAK